MCSLDCETTGLDLYHGCKPFMVSTANEEGVNTWWEWDVNPETRQPKVPREDAEEIQRLIDEADEIVLQNAKFDVRALATIGVCDWPWYKTHDTLIAGHLLASNLPHDLASMVLMYLGVDIKSREDDLKKACEKARRLARSKTKYRIATKEDPTLPSAKGSLHSMDMWLPRVIANVDDYPEDHQWWSLCAEYCNVDSVTTLYLFNEQRKILKKRGLWDIYLERIKLLPIAYQMEERGITLSRDRLMHLVEQYSEESEKAGTTCEAIARTYDYSLELPKSGNNRSLLEFCFGEDQSLGEALQGREENRWLGLPPQKRSQKTGKPSLDKSVLSHYEAVLRPQSKQLRFVQCLLAKRKRDTALSYMESYQRFWLPLNGTDKPWCVLHPSLNPTGTNTLRWSCSNPNEQNISKQEGFNLRYAFGPAPGREWWSLDANNIELRIPAYAAGEQEMIDLFDNPEKPPYFGSYHLLIFDTLHPEKFAKHGVNCKDVYAATWYQWTKNGNFAVQYGAQEATGTADRAYHIEGAQRRIQQRFIKIELLSKKMIVQANKHGYVETMPDKTVCKDRGYPLYCATSKRDGRISPTVPLAFHISGTAMWWMAKAMVRCQQWLNRMQDHYIVMQVHDELVFDFPKGSQRLTVNRMKKLMEIGGDDIGVPTPVGVTYHPNNWIEGGAP